MKLKIAVFLGAFCLLAYLALPLFFSKKPNHFAISQITSNRPNNPLFNTPELTQTLSTEVDKALSQPYTYFGCGGQAFVFFSQDGNYVVKFFKQHHFREPTHLNYIPFITKYRTKKFTNRKKRIEQEYVSYKIGQELMSEETALLYLHLNKTDHLNRILTVKDHLNESHQIDLDRTDFIVQRRASLVYSTIDDQMRQDDIAGAQATIDQVVELILIRCQKGLRDNDPNIATNCGILGKRAIKIDVGRFLPDPKMKEPLFYKSELYHLTRPFRIWLKNHHPKLVSHLDEKIVTVVTQS